MVNFVVEYSENTDRQVINAAFEQIERGGYQKRGILIFHSQDEKSELPFALLPRTKGSSIEYSVSALELALFEEEWGRVVTTVSTLISEYFPQIGITEIHLHPTHYGVKGWQIRQGTRLDVWLRVDFAIEQCISNIVEGITFSLIAPNIAAPNLYSGEILQYKNNVLSFFMQYTKFAALVPDYKSLKEQMQIPEVNIDLLAISMQNYEALGFPSQPAITQKDGGIYLYEQRIDSVLPPNLQKILKLFLNKNGEIATFEEIATEIWHEQSSDKYSLTAITKAVHDLREALENNGLKKEIIFTKRKEGYYINN